MFNYDIIFEVSINDDLESNLLFQVEDEMPAVDAVGYLEKSISRILEPSKFSFDWRNYTGEDDEYGTPINLDLVLASVKDFIDEENKQNSKKSIWNDQVKGHEVIGTFGRCVSDIHEKTWLNNKMLKSIMSEITELKAELKEMKKIKKSCCISD
jgi:hypothetical protein